MPIYDEWPSYPSEPIQFPRESTSGPVSIAPRGELTQEPLPFNPRRLQDRGDQGPVAPYPGRYPGRYSNDGEANLEPGQQNPTFPPVYGGPPEQAPSADVQPARPRYTFPRPYELPYGDL